MKKFTQMMTLRIANDINWILVLSFPSALGNRAADCGCWTIHEDQTMPKVQILLALPLAFYIPFKNSLTDILKYLQMTLKVLMEILAFEDSILDILTLVAL